MRKVILCVVVAIALTVIVSQPARAQEPQLELMRVTCYCPESCPGTVTASGTKPRPNYTCGARKDLIGCIALVYEDDNGQIGKFVGMYMVEDTGNAERIKSGKSIDVYQATLSDAKAYVKEHGDYQWVMFVRGNG